MANQGRYDDPNALVRQQPVVNIPAGGAKVVYYGTPVSDIIVRKFAYVSNVIGTSTGNYTVIVKSGTTALGTISFLGTGAVGTITTSADMNTKIPQGTTLNFTSSADATFSGNVVWEQYLAPDTGSWD